MPLFSERLRMSEAAVEWCKEQGASPESPVNVVTALLALGLVVVLADEEREAIKSAIQWCEDITYGGPNDEEAAATLRALLERTTL